MKRFMLRIAGLTTLFGALSVVTASASAHVSINVGIGVSVAPVVVAAPAPVVVAPPVAPVVVAPPVVVAAAPYAGYAWRPGYYVGYRWIPGAWVPRAQIVDALLNPRLPTLQNTDGDPIEMTTMTYDLGVTAADAFDRLRPLATLRGEAHVDDERYDAAGGIDAAVLTWLKAGNRKHQDWDNTTLGTLRLDGSRLVIEVNSARRRERIAKEISKRFRSTATLVETKTADIVKELQDRRARRGETAEPTTFSTEPERTPEIQALEAELMRKHWDAWIDTKVPAFGNRTPLWRNVAFA